MFSYDDSLLLYCAYYIFRSVSINRIVVPEQRGFFNSHKQKIPQQSEIICFHTLRNESIHGMDICI